MGSNISIDKQVSRLEDILRLDAKHLERVKLEADIPDNITQNIKLWRFHEENAQSKRIISSPISLQNLQNQNFSFLSTECYVVLVVYRRGKDASDLPNSFLSFPHSMWGIVESYNNLTPRGLENPLSTSTSELNLEILDSFLLPTTSTKKERLSMNFEHMIFVWNGKNSNPLIKSLALSSAYNLEALVEKGQDTLLQIFFSGGVILSDNLKNGKVIQLSSTSNKPSNRELEKEISKMSQTIFLFKFLFPLNTSRSPTKRSTSTNPLTDRLQAAAPLVPSEKKRPSSDQQSEQTPQRDVENQESANDITVTAIQPINTNQSSEPSSLQHQQQQQEQQQQQHSSVDSSSSLSTAGAASTIHSLRFFRRQFCVERNPPLPNFYANFIRVPAAPSQDKHSNYLHQPESAKQHQTFPQYSEQLPQPPCNNIHRNNFIDGEWNTEQYIQHGVQLQNTPPTHTTTPPIQSKKSLISMKPLNLSNLNQNSLHLPLSLVPPQSASLEPAAVEVFPAEEEQYYTDGNGSNRHQQQKILSGEQQLLVDQSPQTSSQTNAEGGEPSDSQRRTTTARTYAEYNLQSGLERLQSCDPVIKLNIGFSNVLEDPQEKQNKVSYSARGKDKNYLYINMPLESAFEGQQQQQHIHREQWNTGEEEEQEHQQDNESNQQDRMENQFEGYDEDPYDRPPSTDRYRDDTEKQQPPLSHRGGNSHSAQAMLAEIEAKKRDKMNNFRLGGFSINTNAIKKPHSLQYEETPVSQLENYNNNSGGGDGVEDESDDSEDLYYGYNAEEEENGEPINPYAKIKTFAQKCSEILPKFLYVSGQDVAYNKKKLKRNGITHIINCAGDVCKNMFPDDFVYKFYKLKDTKTENIECIFYDSIEFIEEVARQKGRVYIHCIQGVSRSISLCIAYIIWKQKYDFQDALMFVKKARGVASPNQGFLVQLINFYKRLYSPYDSITIKPRVWCVSSHQVEQPASIVAKMLLEGLYSHNMLDPRGVFIVQSSDHLYVWIGNLIPADRLVAYKSYALGYLPNLRKYESASQDAEIIIEQGYETEEFWQLWFSERPQICYAQNKEWNTWFLDITDGEEEQAQTYFQEELDEEEEEEEPAEGQNQKGVTLLFVYPDPSTKLAVFDYDDLADDSLCILCKLQSDIVKVLIWKGEDFTEPEETEQFFLDEIIQNNFPHHDINKIYVQNETPNQESEEFNDCFSSS